MTSPSPLLLISDLHVSYGGVDAVRGLSLDLREGELTCVIGPNGAGKSTTVAAVAGGVRIKSGSVTFQGVELNGRAPEDIARLGISMVPEGRHVFGSLTVLENLATGTYMRRDRSEAKSDVAVLLERFPRLGARQHIPAARLSGGEQQMLSIARAVLTRPRLMLVDEPSLGLAPAIIDQVYELLLDLKKTNGLTLLVVEQTTERILKYADRIYVVRGGAVQLEGSAAQLRDGAAIKQAYFGFEREGAA